MSKEICLEYLESIRENKYTLEFVMDWNDEDYCLAAVKNNGFALQFVKEQTEEICLVAVKGNGLALQFVEEQTEEICLAAVKQSGEALEYIDKEKFPDVYAYYKLLYN